MAHGSTDRWIGLGFLAAGALLAGLGWRLTQKFKEPPRTGFRDWGLTPRGLLEFAGVLLIIFGLCACGVGLLFLSF